MLTRTLLTVTALLAVCAGLAGAQETSVRLKGTISAVDGSTLTVTTATGSQKVVLADKPRVTFEEPADLAGITSGEFIGAGAVPQPDGTQRAVQVAIFAETMRGAGEGFHPWTGAPGGTMTNATVHDVTSATVDQVSGRMLTLTYNGGQQHLFIPPGTPIVRLSPGDAKAIAVGAKISVNATKHADGSLTAASVTIGKNG
jgi:hypothetical protein